MTWDYDYIITGAGCSGLSLAMYMIHSGKFGDKRILLIDKDLRKSNDKTWCFWETANGLFESVVFRRWDQLFFHGGQSARRMAITPYAYKMIRSIDFYDHCLSVIRQQSNFSLLSQKVDHIFSSDLTTGIITEGMTLHCQYVFNSIIFDKPELGTKDYWLLQHFRGWTIETGHPVFDPATATLMDFRTSQNQGTAFCYVLPFTARKALVEHTVFSERCLSDEEYSTALRSYILDVLRIENYSVSEVENGVIPMTNFHFSSGLNNIINIGTAGGQTKGSSGYTFKFIQRHSRRIVHELITTGDPYFPSRPDRFRFYDSILLNILHHKTLPGEKIFTNLFTRNSPQQVLKFLDNQTSFLEEIGIISSLPTMPFLTAALKQIF